MSVPPAHPESGDSPHGAVTSGDIDDPAAGCSCSSTGSLPDPDAAGEIIVLRVVGEVDLATVSILRAALGEGVQAHPAHFLVDLTRVVFGSARGLGLLAQSGHTAAGHATSFAVRGVSSQLGHVWSLVGEGDLPIGHRGCVAAMTGFGLSSQAEHVHGVLVKARQNSGRHCDRSGYCLAGRGIPAGDSDSVDSRDHPDRDRGDLGAARRRRARRWRPTALLLTFRGLPTPRSNRLGPPTFEDSTVRCR